MPTNETWKIKDRVLIKGNHQFDVDYKVEIDRNSLIDRHCRIDDAGGTTLLDVSLDGICPPENLNFERDSGRGQPVFNKYQGRIRYVSLGPGANPVELLIGVIGYKSDHNSCDGFNDDTDTEIFVATRDQNY